MIQRVYEQVSATLTDAVVATDDERIEAAVNAFGGRVVMTGTHHKSGTDRCYEAFTKVGRGTSRPAQCGTARCTRGSSPKTRIARRARACR